MDLVYMSEAKSQSPASIQVFTYFAILLSYPLFSFIWRRSYPADSGEVVLLFCIVILLSVALAFFAKLIRDELMAAITLLITLLVFLIQFNFRPEGFLFALAISAFLYWKLGTRIISISIPVLAMMIIAAFLESSNQPRNFQNTDPVVEINTELPPVVHILLDGFIGTAGLPATVESEVFNQAANQFLTEFEFTHFPKAYSRYPVTENSLYTAMNFEHESDFRFRIEAANRTVHSFRFSMLFDSTDKDPAMLKLRTQRYLEQAGCGLWSLRNLFNEMKKSEIFDDSFIVLHGDHGSGISRTAPNVLNHEFLTLEDMRAHYSTLFAIKEPNGKYGVNTQALSLPPLIEAASLSIADQGKDVSYFLEGELTAHPEVTDEYVYMVNGVAWSRVNLSLFD